MKYLIFALLVLCPTCATMHELGAIGTRSEEHPQAIATNPPGNCIQYEALKRADWERRHQRAMNDYSVPKEDYYVQPTWDSETGALTQMTYSSNRYAGEDKPEYGYRIINGKLAPNSDVNNRGPLLSPKQREEINAQLAGSNGNSYVNEQQLKALAPRTMPAPSVAGAVNGKTAATLPTGSVDHDSRATKSYISGRQKRKAEPKNTGQKEKEIQGTKIAASSDTDTGSKPSAKTGSVHYVCVPKCYVRQTPDTNSPAIAELLELDWVKVLKTKSSWCQVETGAGLVGWLNQNMIK
jgi:Bacterial SH3 domain